MALSSLLSVLYVARAFTTQARVPLAVGKRLMIFVDDLNMPKVDTYGTQQPIALLHFLVGRGHMYDRSGKDLDLRT